MSSKINNENMNKILEIVFSKIEDQEEGLKDLEDQEERLKDLIEFHEMYPNDKKNEYEGINIDDMLSQNETLTIENEEMRDRIDELVKKNEALECHYEAYVETFDQHKKLKISYEELVVAHKNLIPINERNDKLVGELQSKIKAYEAEIKEKDQRIQTCEDHIKDMTIEQVKDEILERIKDDENNNTASENKHYFIESSVYKGPENA